MKSVRRTQQQGATSVRLPPGTTMLQRPPQAAPRVDFTRLSTLDPEALQALTVRDVISLVQRFANATGTGAEGAFNLAASLLVFTTTRLPRLWQAFPRRNPVLFNHDAKFAAQLINESPSEYEIRCNQAAIDAWFSNPSHPVYEFFDLFSGFLEKKGREAIEQADTVFLTSDIDLVNINTFRSLPHFLSTVILSEFLRYHGPINRASPQQFDLGGYISRKVRLVVIPLYFRLVVRAFLYPFARNDWGVRRTWSAKLAAAAAPTTPSPQRTASLRSARSIDGSLRNRARSNVQAHENWLFVADEYHFDRPTDETIMGGSVVSVNSGQALRGEELADRGATRAFLWLARLPFEDKTLQMIFVPPPMPKDKRTSKKSRRRSRLEESQMTKRERRRQRRRRRKAQRERENYLGLLNPFPEFPFAEAIASFSKIAQTGFPENQLEYLRQSIEMIFHHLPRECVEVSDVDLSLLVLYVVTHSDVFKPGCWLKYIEVMGAEIIAANQEYADALKLFSSVVDWAATQVSVFVARE